MKYAADFRRIARDSLRGRWLLAAVTGFVASLFGATLSASSSSTGVNIDLLRDQESVDAVGGMYEGAYDMLRAILPFAAALIVFALVMSLVRFIFGGAATLGYARFNLQLVDRQKATVNDVFSCFDRFGAGFCMALLRDIFIALWSLLFVIPGIVKAYAYAMAPYILLENPRMTATESITASKELMMGNKGRLFCLDLSFFGWSVLATLPLVTATALYTRLTLPIAVLCFLATAIASWFILAYREAAYAAFYREISAEAQRSQPSIAE